MPHHVNGYACNVCNAAFTHEKEASDCEEFHRLEKLCIATEDIIHGGISSDSYQMARAEIARLWNLKIT